ncbi:hypothetical protein D9613_012757 [Agrocybe pediades]|uniref:Uncharacterized protein n=1 Tax=Agrocybe pediades TaxID=84607 RepID=A0A8H4QKJ5_9AGAR|nr:hypothetical protein D9613_012757 [Agrocybe pediades]
MHPKPGFENQDTIANQLCAATGVSLAVTSRKEALYPHHHCFGGIVVVGFANNSANVSATSVSLFVLFDWTLGIGQTITGLAPTLMVAQLAIPVTLDDSEVSVASVPYDLVAAPPLACGIAFPKDPESHLIRVASGEESIERAEDMNNQTSYDSDITELCRTGSHTSVSNPNV